MISEFVASLLAMEVRPCSQSFDDCDSRAPLEPLLEQGHIPSGILSDLWHSGCCNDRSPDVISVSAVSPGVAVNSYKELASHYTSSR